MLRQKETWKEEVSPWGAHRRSQTTRVHSGALQVMMSITYCILEWISGHKICIIALVHPGRGLSEAVCILNCVILLLLWGNNLQDHTTCCPQLSGTLCLLQLYEDVATQLMSLPV